MIDAAVPFRKALGEAFTGDNAAAAILEAAKVARAAADSTADITASLGRSCVLGEKSLGTPDPGAISFSILMTELGRHLSCKPAASPDREGPSAPAPPPRRSTPSH